MPESGFPADPRIAQLAAQLRARMATRGIGQEGLASELSISQSHLSRILGGRRKRWTPTLARICHRAAIELEAPAEALEPVRELQGSIERLVRQNPEAAVFLAQLVRALSPWIRKQFPARHATPDPEVR